MKTIKRLLAMLLIISVLLTMASCYVISGQKMRRVKGTYKLTHYTYTPSYERKEGYTPNSKNYVEDEEYLYEDYLIITGTSTGYYVHKAVGEEPYVKEITLSYEYDSDDSSKVEYVIFNDSITVNENSGIHRLGVTRNNLNYAKNALDYTELFTKRPMRSEAISVRWERVDKATDLSYVQKQIGSMKKYDYKSYAYRGIYELVSIAEVETGKVLESQYQYLFYVIDTADGTAEAKVVYATKENPTERITKTVSISNDSGDWSRIRLDGAEWIADPIYSTHYYNELDGIKSSLTCVSQSITDVTLDYIIESRLPNE